MKIVPPSWFRKETIVFLIVSLNLLGKVIFNNEDKQTKKINKRKPNYYLLHHFWEARKCVILEFSLSVFFIKYLTSIIEESALRCGNSFIFKTLRYLKFLPDGISKIRILLLQDKIKLHPKLLISPTKLL